MVSMIAKARMVNGVTESESIYLYNHLVNGINDSKNMYGQWCYWKQEHNVNNKIYVNFYMDSIVQST